MVTGFPHSLSARLLHFCSSAGLGVPFVSWGIPPYHSELVAFYRIICFENTENKESQIQTTM